jgi:predicted ATPase/DNA-binding CsgD family transcriptional regulator
MTSGEPQAFALSKGTVTFLLCDVESSGPRGQGAGTAAALVDRYHEVLDRAISCHGGILPAERGEGDAVVGVFSRASDALAAALEAQLRFCGGQRSKGGPDLSVRMAVHTGEAQVGGEGGYLGEALERCARMLAVGYGEQVLVSAAAASVVGGRLPDGAMLVDLGAHRLSDLGRREELWQLTHGELRAEFPPLRSLDAFRHNLPAQLTPLIGRSDDISEVGEFVAGERLVTLTGSAGVGKTRLALAVAAEMVERYYGGVWWVDLAALSDPDAIGRTALAAVAAREAVGVPAATQLVAVLGDAAALIVLDNCEHLVTACAQFVSDLLASSGALTVLATSREPLRVPGELTWRVPSLACPDPEGSIDLSVLSQYDAVALFIDRARRVRPSFAVSEADAPALAQICHRLDGIPLAIELAAARCRQLSAKRIAVELDDRFRLLTGGARTVMPRQQTLAASIDWSHERLDDRERVVFRRLGVFSGAFPLEAAGAVTAAPGRIASEEVFDVVSRLVDKSLVVAGEGVESEPRYRLLESLRAYALDRARRAGELTALRDAHASWWTAWLEPTFAMPTDGVLQRVEEFHDNLQAALEWTMNDPRRGLRLLRPLARAWTQLGRNSDAIPAADRLLGASNARQHTSAWLAAAYATLELYLWAHGPKEWHALFDRIEHVAIEAGDEYHLAIARQHRGGYEEATLARDLARQRGDHYQSMRSTIFAVQGLAEDDPAAADPELAAIETLVEAAGNRDLRERMLIVKAMAARCEGDLRRCLELSQQVIDSPTSARIGDVLIPMSFAALLARDEDALRRIAERARIEQRRAPGSTRLTETATHRLELLDGGSSQLNPYLCRTDGLLVPTFGTLWLDCREAIDAGSATVALDAVRTLTRPVPHGRAVLAAVEAAATGEENRWHDALSLALDHHLRLIAVDALEGIGVAAARNESWAESLRLLASADRLRDDTSYRWRFGFEQHAVDAARAAAHNALGEDAARAAHADGRDLDWRQAADYARRARGERKRPHHGWASLTPTELQVVALVAEGLTNSQIGDRLFISHSTVKTHLEHIFAKLGVRRRSELAAETARRVTP